MTQTEARQKAKEKGYPYVATTVCALRGQFEQGKDAYVWIVVPFPGETR